MIYADFVEFVAAEADLAAGLAAPPPVSDVLRGVASDEVVLASVSVEMRALVPEPERRGGHLVLVIDVAADASRLCFHDPAGDRPERSRAVWLERDTFARYYAERGIAVALPRA